MQGKEQSNGNHPGNQNTREDVDRGQPGGTSSTQGPGARVPHCHGAVGSPDLTDDDGGVDHSPLFRRLGPGDLAGLCVRDSDAAVRRLLSEPVRQALGAPGLDVRLYGQGPRPGCRRHVGLVADLVLHVHRRGRTYRILHFRRPGGVVHGHPYNDPARDLLLHLRRGLLAGRLQGHQDLLALDACCSRRFRSPASLRWRA